MVSFKTEIAKWKYGYVHSALIQLYVVRTPERDAVFKHLRGQGIGANVHYVPVHMHPYYQNLGYEKGICPVAEAAYAKILTLPLWPGMDVEDMARVASAAVTE